MASESHAEEIYERHVGIEHLECLHRQRLGNNGDGGWDICMPGPYTPQTPCLVYSFGINFDWSFDEAISTEFGCQVRSFDPSMEVGEHEHNRLVSFYPWGVGPQNEILQKGRGWPLKTPATILTDLGDDKRVIDYMKMDIEGWEWEVLLTAFTENVLSRVKQFAIEIHTAEVRGVKRGTSTKADYMKYIRVLDGLESLGFRKWYTHYNNVGIYESPRTNNFVTCCLELVYINMNFLQPSYLADGLPPLNISNYKHIIPMTTTPAPWKPKQGEQPWNGELYPEFRDLSPRTSMWAVSLTYNHTLSEAEYIFYSYISEVTITCPVRVDVGAGGDTTWGICNQHPYIIKPTSLVYSFSSVLDFSFENDIAKQFGSKIMSFNPHHNVTRRRIHRKLYVSNMTLGRPLDNNNLHTFSQILEKNSNTKNVIDILRLDLEDNEWGVINTICMESSLRNIRQILLQIHTKEYHSHLHLSTNVSDFVLYLHILNKLEKSGFRLWSSVEMDRGLYQSTRTKHTRPSSIKLHYINTYFMW